MAIDYKLFSADDHIDFQFLPGDLWVKRVPAEYRDRVPRLEESTTGPQWFAEGKIVGPGPSRQHKSTWAFGKEFVPVSHGPDRWRPTTTELRLEDMDRDGVECHVLYGAISQFLRQKDELQTVCIRAYNEWVAEFAATCPERLIGLGYVPFHDAQAAADEIYHCAQLGLKGVQFLVFDAYKLPWDVAWEPMWNAAEETGLIIHSHVTGGTWSNPKPQDPLSSAALGPHVPPNRGVYATWLTVVPHQVDELVASLIFSGTMMRHPRLRFVVAEASIGWIPYLLERMDRKFEERHSSLTSHRENALRDDAADLEHKPSYYWNRQMYATFQEDPVGVKILSNFPEHLDPATILWASDYPHPDSTWPVSNEAVESMFKDVDPAVTRLVLRENGMKLYDKAS